MPGPLRAVVFVLSISLSQVVSAGAQTDAVRVVYYPPWNISKLPMYVARASGIFERNGLKIAWHDPGSNGKLLDTLKNGAADIAVVSANHVVQNNAAGGPPMLLVGNTGYNYSALLAVATIKSAADLKGKKVGTGEPGSTPDQLTRLALRKIGIDPSKDVDLVYFEERRSSDRVKSLLNGEISAVMVTAEAMYELQKSGKIDGLHRLTDHKQLRIYAGGGADYAVSSTFLRNRREDVKRFMSGICEGIALAKKEPKTALGFVAKTGRDLDAAGIEYLYRLYTTDVIPPRPHVRPEAIELAVQMATPTVGSSQPITVQDVTDAGLVPELENEGRCNF
jgi:NitT/TauT family transport system substrate-binding protein